jgi:hypothetical protein
MATVQTAWRQRRNLQVTCEKAFLLSLFHMFLGRNAQKIAVADKTSTYGHLQVLQGIKKLFEDVFASN